MSDAVVKMCGMTDEVKCPMGHGGVGGAGADGGAGGHGSNGHGGHVGRYDRMPTPAEGGGNRNWWPEQLNLKMLDHDTDAPNPNDHDFDYAAEFGKLNLDEVAAGIVHVMYDSQPWWPADFGNYGPFFIRMSWHAAGTYRAQDGRGGAGGGQQRFAPLNSWPDNQSLDKARRLLWPVKKKYGRALSWADLLVLAGTVAQKDMGLPIFGFGGGRVDEWEPDDDVYWGPETTWLAEERWTKDRKLEPTLAAAQMGLIYVNPEGPGGVPDPLGSAADIRETFGRMGMNDEETVALIAGGHTFGKTHGAARGEDHVGPDPEDAPMEQMGLGWKNDYKSGVLTDAITSGPEVTWTYNPTQWDNEYLEILYRYEWELTKSPAGAWQWHPKAGQKIIPVPEADGKGTREPRMLTSDIALRVDPEYDKISRRFRDDFGAFTEAYAKAWYKLTHRDMGPYVRLVGSWVPGEPLPWQDPLPPFPDSGKAWLSSLLAAQAKAARGEDLTDDDRRVIGEYENELAAQKAAIAASGLSIPELVSTAWASASSFRSSDHRGGANGARIALEPQRSWPVNNPALLNKTLPVLQKIASEHNSSLADMIVLAGGVGVEQAAKAAGVDITVPFLPGRTDATQDQTDVGGFNWLQPLADGFRNWSGRSPLKAEYSLVDRANLLGLRMPEMTVLVAGLRTLGATFDGSDLGQLEDHVGVLDNSWFVNLLSMDNEWKAVGTGTKDPRYAPHIDDLVTHDFEPELTGKHGVDIDGHDLDGAGAGVQGNADYFIGFDRATGQPKYRATRADLVFGANSVLRAQSEFYAADDAKEKFVRDFVHAWTKIMNADRYDVPGAGIELKR